MDNAQTNEAKSGRGRKPALIVLILFTLVNLNLAGCNTVSFLHPPGEGLAIRDQRLEDSWLFVNDGNYQETGLMTITYDEEKGQIQVKLQMLNDEEESNIEVIFGVLYKEGNRNYLSIQELFSGTPEAYSLLTYRIRGEKLFLWGAEVDPFVMAIESEALTGRFDRHRITINDEYFIDLPGDSRNIVITDSEDRVRKLVIRNHESIFTEDPGVFFRYKENEERFRGR
jgi:hypothetical protein